MTSIGKRAFGGCSGLTSVTIGNSVTSIGDDAFSDCASVMELHSNNSTPPTFNGALTGINVAQCKLYVPIGSKKLYALAGGWSNFVNIIEEEVKGTQCATPEISLVNGKIQFSCETEGVKYHYTIKADQRDVAETTEDNVVDFVKTYTVTCYASADGYADSETATATIKVEGGGNGDVNGDGKIDMQDANIIVNQYLGK